jgi:hypothetical protein
MTEDNDLLLKQFFNDAAQQQIEDNGFTERVMARLAETPQYATTGASPSAQTSFKKFNCWWTLTCVAVFAVLFVVLRGWELLAVQLEVLLRTVSVESLTINTMMLATVLFGLLFVGVGEVIYNEKLEMRKF